MNAQTQPVVTGRGLGDKDRSHREEFANHALAGVLQELQSEGKLAPIVVSDAPSAGDGAEAHDDAVIKEDHMGTDWAISELNVRQNEVEATDVVSSDTAVVMSVPVVEETPQSVAPAVVEERRSAYSTASRDHVASRQRAQFTVAPLAPLAVEDRPKKPKQLPKDAPWGVVTLGRFLKTNNADMVSLVREIRSEGKRPVLTLEIRAPEGKGTRVDFSLSIALGKGGNEHVKLKAFAAVGVFSVLIPEGMEVFHDELVLGEPSAPERFTATVKVNGILNAMNAFLTEMHMARQQR